MLACALAAGRIAIGAGLWLAPARSGRALGFEQLDGAALALGRVAATRDLALGGWQLASAGDRDGLRRATATVAGVDAADALAFALALRGSSTRTAAVRGLPAAASAALAGIWLSARLRRD